MALAAAIDDPVTSAWVPYDRGVIALQERRYTEADRCLREALSRFREDDNPFGVASALCQLSHVEASLGNVRSAVALAEEAIERLGSEAATLALAESRYALGLALSAAGQIPEALEQLDQALGIYQECTQALGEGMVHHRRAEIHLGAGRPAQAGAEAEQALAVLGRVGALGAEPMSSSCWATPWRSGGSPRGPGPAGPGPSRCTSRCPGRRGTNCGTA